MKDPSPLAHATQASLLASASRRIRSERRLRLPSGEAPTLRANHPHVREFWSLPSARTVSRRPHRPGFHCRDKSYFASPLPRLLSLSVENERGRHRERRPLLLSVVPVTTYL